MIQTSTDGFYNIFIINISSKYTLIMIVIILSVTSYGICAISVVYSVFTLD